MAKLDHLLSSTDLLEIVPEAPFRGAMPLMDLLCESAERHRRSGMTVRNALAGRVIANLFYEPSTRTSLSFHVAASKLNAKVYSVDDVQFSSLAKGESLEDTIRVVSSMADCIVLRHPLEEAAVRAAQVSLCPVINAGCGAGEHPTQTLVDMFTLKANLGQDLRLKHIGLMGDLLHSRTIHSLFPILAYESAVIHLISPRNLRLPPGLFELDAALVRVHEELHECISELDALYLTRAQVERHQDCQVVHEGTFLGAQYTIQDIARRLSYSDTYGVTTHHMEQAKPHMALLHPLPRTGELPKEIDDDPRALYFQQAANGVWVRMALLEYLLT